jgi:hypothetical protein
MSKLKQSLGLQKKTGKEGKKAFESIGKSLKTMAIAAAGAWAAIKTISVAIDSIKAGEQLKTLETQFDTLAERAGFSGEEVKNGMIKAADGLIGVADILKVANEQVVAFGKSAERLPEVMELARRASRTTGKSVQETFIQLTQILKQGSAEGLKQFGIMLDQKSVLEDFAIAHGEQANALTQQGKATAVLNAALKEGQRIYGGIDETTMQTSDSVTRFKVAIDDLKEAIGQLMNVKYGKWFRDLTDSFTIFSKQQEAQANLEKQLSSNDPLEKLYAKRQIQLKRLGDTSVRQMESQKDIYAKGLDWAFGWAIAESKGLTLKDMQIKAQERRLKVTNKEIEALEKARGIDKKADREKEEAALKREQEFTNALVSRDNQIKSAQKINQLEMQAISARLILADSEENLGNIIEARQDQMLENLQTELQNLDLLRDKKILKHEEWLVAKQALEVQYQAQLAELSKQEGQIRSDFFQDQIDTTEDSWDSFFTGFSLQLQKSASETKTLAQLGSQTADSFKNNFAQAFVDIGSGAATFGQAMTKAFLAPIAELAAAAGKAIMLQGFAGAPFTLWKVPIGASLLALSGVLSAAAGSGTPVASSAGGATGSAGGTRSEVPNFQVADDVPGTAEEEEMKRKFVSITIEGNYFDTEETRSRLVEMIREESDATDFKVQSVGGGL